MWMLWKMGLLMPEIGQPSQEIATDTTWEVANLSMKVLGGIGNKDVFPVEKMVRDLRLSRNWTGPNEIMNLLILKINHMGNRYTN